MILNTKKSFQKLINEHEQHEIDKLRKYVHYHDRTTLKVYKHPDEVIRAWRGQ